MTTPTQSVETLLLVATALQEARLCDGEGNFYRLFDLLDFSGENKARMITDQLAKAAIDALQSIPEPLSDEGVSAELRQWLTADRLEQIKEIAITDDWHKNLVGSDVRLVVGDLLRAREYIAALNSTPRLEAGRATEAKWQHVLEDGSFDHEWVTEFGATFCKHCEAPKPEVD